MPNRPISLLTWLIIRENVIKAVLQSANIIFICFSFGCYISRLLMYNTRMG